ncbi:MAG: hypothetical protein QE271_11975 [Bacteriovoracaceae bacterium]|nr:hypothetical protein [Bacteriovoracaceae bacterium]
MSKADLMQVLALNLEQLGCLGQYAQEHLDNEEWFELNELLYSVEDEYEKLTEILSTIKEMRP